MKNRKLIFAVVLLTTIILVSFVKGLLQPSITTQKNEKIRIGVLQFVSHPALDEIYQGFVEELKKSGYKKGEKIELDYQNGQADQSKLTSMSQQLLQKHPDVLVGIATPAAQSLANQTKEVPIILGAISDPKGAGLVESNEHPGGNITGVSDLAPITKQLELAQELIPEAKSVGILYASSEANSKFQVDLAKEAAAVLGLEVKTFAVPSSNEISQTVHQMAQTTDFILIPNDNTIANAMQTVVSVANQYKIPIIPPVRSMVEQGGLATVGVNQYQLGVQTAKMAIQIIEKKEKPAEMPIYLFEEGDVSINQKQADLLGIKIPEKYQSFVIEEKEEY